MPVWGTCTREELLVLVGQLARANADLQRAVGDLRLVNQEQQALVVRLQEELARLRDGPAPPAPGHPAPVPPFVKPNRKTQEERKRQAEQPGKPRKRRPHGFARRREAACQVTRVIEHHPQRCARCGRHFGEGAGSKHSSRQIIELPVAPVEVIEHQFFACTCGVCGRRTLARPDLSAVAPGKSRLGVGLMSYIAYLRTACRMPLATIQRLLAGVYGVELSEGGIVRVLHTIARAGQSAYDDLLSEVRRSLVVQADETLARQDGINGYEWSLSTPTVRYYHRDASRGAAVIQTLLGYDPNEIAARSPHAARRVRDARQRQPSQRQPSQGEPSQGEQVHRQGQQRFHGGLVSDFYAAYDWYPGPQQKCLVHLDRDLDELKAGCPEDPALGTWVEQVLDVVQRAKDYARAQREKATDQQPQRAQVRRQFERELDALARPYATSPNALPQRVLAERIHKYRHRLFVFVEFPAIVPADNNAAERAIRPFVIHRKISGGTRSERGSQTRDVLMSLFGTWLLGGQDALLACRQSLVPSAASAPG